VAVLGDLTLDVVLAPAGPLVAATDVPGRVVLRQGGSAANTARWLARSGARTTLVTAVGRDAEGRALVAALQAEGVTVRALRVRGGRTGRIGVLVEPGGERSFVADRGAADALGAEDLREGWFDGVALLHLPAYSLIGERLGGAARRAATLVHARGGLVSVDLASVGPLLAVGRRRAVDTVRSAAPDLLFATLDEARALAGEGGEAGEGRKGGEGGKAGEGRKGGEGGKAGEGRKGGEGGKAGEGRTGDEERNAGEPARRAGRDGYDGREDRLLELAPLAVLKRGPAGATLLMRDGPRVLRFDVATRPIAARDTTGAGDAFDAGFIVAWVGARSEGRGQAAALRRAALAGHRTAGRHLTSPWPELRLR
jgi:sugar/nucleoside kinase (ribokinase family)